MNEEVKNLKITMAVVITIICLGVVVSILCVKGLNLLPVSKNSIENEFSKNKDILTSIAEYLETQEYTTMYITSTSKNGEMFVYKNDKEMGKNIEITDNLMAAVITDLFEKYKYQVIYKGKNGIYFQRWSNRDYGRGIVYSINGERPENEQITKLEPLSQKCWYFYEEE